MEGKRTNCFLDEKMDTAERPSVAELGRLVLGGYQITRDQALELFNLEERTDILDLIAWANRIREKYRGNGIHLCSIVNAKSGGCPEDCKFCAQSAFYKTNAPRYELIEPEPMLRAAKEAERNMATAFGIVTAWKEIKEGESFDRVCELIKMLGRETKLRPDASLGLIKKQSIADRLRDAGLVCYNHNLETSRRFFPFQCTTHSYDERLETIWYLKRAGIQICCGGIIGIGESREDRCDLAFALREIAPECVPINILAPIPGTPFEHNEPLSPMEILKTIACFRFVLPQQEIIIAGGRMLNLRDAQSFVFAAGASGLMIGNYLTTTNRPPRDDLCMIRDLGLEVRKSQQI
ncbi:MAG: biotin synthase BioB [Verrucomicrobiae bacterium]|nr:biotin synthase BioB [Verrucomicrobiae bacterium]